MKQIFILPLQNAGKVANLTGSAFEYNIIDNINRMSVMTEIKCDAQKNKIRFAIVGSGYRASFYIRIAKYYSNKYELVGVLCRSSEKAELIHNRYDVNAVTDENIIRGSEPSFVVVCVNKVSIAEVSAYWRSLEFTVLCETPVGLNLDDLLKVYSTRQEGGRP